MIGFKNFTQSQLLADEFYYPNNVEIQPWLVYYIAKPLVGSPTPHIAGQIGPSSKVLANGNEETAFPRQNKDVSGKKNVGSFKDVLDEYPVVARHMQPGLDKVLRGFQSTLQEQHAGREPRLRPRRQRQHSISSATSSAASANSGESNGFIKAPSLSSFRTDEEEQRLRRSFEAAVYAVVDSFEQLEKQDLTNVVATSELRGSTFESLIEQHISEQLHDSVLFPALCKSRQSEDKQLDSNIHQMACIDVAQVGISIEGGLRGKHGLASRIERSIDQFRQLGVAGSPRQMVNILLAVQKLITSVTAETSSDNTNSAHEEKESSVGTINADTLVSLLLVVVIRSQVRHLHARLAYMRNFVVMDDVESGETGYALSTFEAVLAYLLNDEGGLRKASRKNRQLWHAVQDGNLGIVRGMLEPSPNGESVEPPSHPSMAFQAEHELQEHNQESMVTTVDMPNGRSDENAERSNLAHVFPFQHDNSGGDSASTGQKPRKRVSMNLRSLSISSDRSWRSRTTTIASANSAMEGDISAATLAQTQDADGKSTLMMAIESRRPSLLAYLLSLEEFYPTEFLLEDVDNEGTTLLSAAVQTGQLDLVIPFLHHLESPSSQKELQGYLARPDKRGRSAAHYFFNCPILISRLGPIIPWMQKDKNGQTPLLAFCRCYDHPHYLEMIEDALYFATRQQDDGLPLHLDNHIDAKGNTLLHTINDPNLAVHILRHCDSNPNGPNVKRFTPLMVASKFGRLDMVRAFFGDRRVDVQARELRGMTAVELAKDDDVRNRIDDMILVSNVPGPDGRATAITRAFLAEEDNIRLIIKSAVRNDNGMISVTTCRRSLADFENLANWLSGENPASWLPSVFNFRSPFQIPSKPSRAALKDIQIRLDRFLRIMFSHSTFSTHPLLYEFVLFPEIQPDMMADRSRRRIEIRPDNIREDFEPVADVRAVESFVAYARDSVRGVDQNLKSVVQRVSNTRNITADHATAFALLSQSLSALKFVPETPHLSALHRLAAYYAVPESDPYKLLHTDLLAQLSTTMAILSSLSRPHQLITQLSAIQRTIDRQSSSLRSRSDRWPLGLLEDTRKNLQADLEKKAKKARDESRQVGCELAYTQQTVAGELASWQEEHAKMGRRAIRELAQKIVIKEKDRVDQMRSAIRGVATVRKV